jgi:hypothetical protein
MSASTSGPTCCGWQCLPFVSCALASIGTRTGLPRLIDIMQTTLAYGCLYLE